MGSSGFYSLQPPRSGQASRGRLGASAQLPFYNGQRRTEQPPRKPLHGPVELTRGSRRALTAERISPGSFNMLSGGYIVDCGMRKADSEPGFPFDRIVRSLASYLYCI
ncbi:hypothetical protein NDU88_003719 [Pleurodeles waltl]|uniref:Uncharacterized protein n=1 Tax=Pleurodeles waltl TaxID=8319 RepID=A0AAV7WUE8_PLEWA|nr:hypothetical protein NDU88_003719 [Pleurodeles waltl]